ncbi:hypothetical protein ED92_10620 [Amycolatopsis sp. MJM2582]|uniref:hypothetical protein n=1 Tax=Amycolatopsis sp. MJM2582 TaxID=1427749 RepID=UPI0004FF68AD|nr:hypothetical protein [Amycolatopsis sp. MJM2582]KFZ80787.1 hypothetical protein ED92_10620 [Amycolatopsis sp. MJM2582]
MNDGDKTAWRACRAPRSALPSLTINAIHATAGIVRAADPFLPVWALFAELDHHGADAWRHAGLICAQKVVAGSTYRSNAEGADLYLQHAQIDDTTPPPLAAAYSVVAATLRGGLPAARHVLSETDPAATCTVTRALFVLAVLASGSPAAKKPLLYNAICGEYVRAERLDRSAIAALMIRPPHQWQSRASLWS